MLGITFIAFASAPLVGATLAAKDLARRRKRLPSVRLYGLGLQYLFNDSVEILAAPILWLFAGFGTRNNSRASRRRHGRLQRWSVDLLARRAEQLLGLRLDIEGLDQLGGGPAIVINRHVSLLDASLPALLYGAAAERGNERLEVRGVITAGMLMDPGFDLIYGQLGSVFINRDRGTQARSALHLMGRSLDATSVAVICPEGRLFDSSALERALVRLRDTDPHRARRLDGLRHVLPPRPGGIMALLDGAPSADVVVIEHCGFEQIPTLAELSRSAPVDHPIRVKVRRIPRSEIPDDEAGRVTWLDEQWVLLDDWIDLHLRDSGADTADGDGPRDTGDHERPRLGDDRDTVGARGGPMR